jgi:hypothetical protein
MSKDEAIKIRIVEQYGHVKFDSIGNCKKYNEHWKVNGKTFHTYPTKQQIEDLYNCPTCGQDHEGNVPRECETGDGV